MFWVQVGIQGTPMRNPDKTFTFWVEVKSSTSLESALSDTK